MKNIYPIILLAILVILPGPAAARIRPNLPPRNISCVSCMPPPAGCRYTASSCATCGTLTCNRPTPPNRPTACVSCAPAPTGCTRVGASCQTCGTLTCNKSTSCVSCRPAPSGCRYINGSCAACGQVVCTSVFLNHQPFYPSY